MHVVCENVCKRIYFDRAEDVEVVCNTIQSHLTKLIGHHHCNSIKETIQVFKWDLFSSVSLKEDVLYFWQPPATEITIKLNYYLHYYIKIALLRGGLYCITLHITECWS